MTSKKQNAIKNEIELFCRYFTAEGSAEDILCAKNPTRMRQIIADYFFSHVDDDGESISLESFLKTNGNTNAEYFHQVNNEFCKYIFAENKPLYFFDVDNTLTQNGKLSCEKADFISHFDSGRVVLSTGKAYSAIAQVSQKCGLTNSYAGCLNGSVIYKNGETEVLSGLGEESKPLLEQAKNSGLEYVFYYPDGAYALAQLSQKNFQNMHTYDENYTIVSQIDYKNVIKILFFVYDGETDKENIVKQIAQKYTGLTALRTGHHCYEILRKNQHKGNAVKLIAERLGVYYRLSVGVGDSMNDLKLLDYVGKPFVVSDASEELSSYGFAKLSSDRNTDIVNLMKEYK